jgi:uncharacterized protein (DUF2336 family)
LAQIRDKDAKPARDDLLIHVAWGGVVPSNQAGASPTDGIMTVDQILRLAADRRASSRSRLAAIMRDLIDGRRGHLSDREWGWMSEILHTLIGGIEKPVRRKLAKTLGRLPVVPRSLITRLANDDIDIAYPVLVNSQLLADEDLIEIILYRLREHQLAIALRENLSESVSDVLVEHGSTPVIVALLRNEKVNISRAALDYLVEQSRRIGEFQEPLIERNELPRALAQRMFAWVSASLRETIVRRWGLKAEEIDVALREALEESRLTFLGESEGGTASERLMGELHANGGTNLVALGQLLSEGHVSLFLDGLRMRTRLRPVLLRRLVFEDTGEGLLIILRALGASADQFSTLYLLTRTIPRQFATAEGPGIRAIPLGYLTTLAAAIPPEVARTVVRFWAEDVEYQAALRRISAVIQ